jgi:hypothetical protein
MASLALLLQLQKIPAIPIEITKDRNGSVRLYARFLTKQHASRAKGLVVAPEIVRVQNRNTRPRKAVRNHAALMFVARIADNPDRQPGAYSDMSTSGSGPRPAPRSCHEPDAIGHDQKSVGEAHPRRQRRVHLASETDDSKRSKKQPETAPGHKRRPSQLAGQQKLRFAAGEASVDQGERNR